MRGKDRRGFTLIEMIVVLGILGFVTAMGLPSYLAVQAGQEESACWSSRENIQRAIALEQAMGHEIDVETFLESGGDESFSKPPTCPSGGTYSLVEGEEGYQVMCSVHTGVIEMQSELGDTRQEIVDGFIALTMDFYESNNRYPRSWGDYVFEDIGLNAEDWSEAIDHVLYEPKGDRLGIVPEAGFQFSFLMETGEIETLTNEDNYALLYNYDTQRWYYHSIEPGNLIDYESLSIGPE